MIGLFLTVFLSGHFFIFKISQAAHQNKFRSYIQQDLAQLKKIDINPSQLYSDSKEIKWLDDNREVMIGDFIYDVVFTKNSGKTVSLYLINDDDERSLLDKYNKLADSIFDESNPSKQDVVKDFLSLKCLQYNSLNFVPENLSLLNSYAAYTVSITSVFLSQETPPPNTVA